MCVCLACVGSDVDVNVPIATHPMNKRSKKIGSIVFVWPNGDREIKFQIRVRRGSLCLNSFVFAAPAFLQSEVNAGRRTLEDYAQRYFHSSLTTKDTEK